MVEERWDSGRSMAIGAALLITTALVTGVLVANWNGKEALKRAMVASSVPVRQTETALRAPDSASCIRSVESAAPSTPGHAGGP